MKLSSYNIFVSANDEKKLIYNAFSGSLSAINSVLAGKLKEQDLDFLDLPHLSELSVSLLDQGILIDDDLDELGEFEKMHLRWKKGTESVEFNALLTYDCNFECPYCYQGRGKKGEEIHGFRYMSNDLLNSTTEFIKKTVRDRDAKKIELVLYGGEPFLPRAREMGKVLTEEISNWAKDNNKAFALHVLSNGSLIDAEIINWLSGFETRLQIPVDGNPEMHNRYRFYKDTGQGSFDDIVNVLRLTRGTGIETHLRISLTDETYPTMEDLLNILQAEGLNHVYPDFCYITAFTEACETFKGHTLSDLKLFRVMPELWRMAHEKGFPIDIRPQVQPLPCSSVADGSYIIDPFSEVYKCWELVGLKEHMVGTIDKMGNLEKTDVYGDVLERNPVKIEQCRDHIYLPACGGGCVCKAHWKNDTYHESGCGSEKYLLTEKIKVYSETVVGEKEIVATDDLYLQKIEGPQEPRMSHCYVLV